tara:strand:+ start:1442 stop:2557 length:1116 start_codon:yes stop_codon:yes gene_type:complete
VSEEQLNAANGRVRCGACLNIFDAIAYQISSKEELKQDKKSLQKDDQSLLEDEYSFNLDDPLDLESELLEPPSQGNNDEDSVFADDPQEDKQDKGYSGSTMFGDELSSSFLELEKSGKDKFKTQFLKDESSETSDEELVDESWADSILDDLDKPENDRVEPSLILNEKTETPEALEPEENLTASQQEFTPFSQKDLNAINFEYEQDSSNKNKWFISSILFILNFSLLLILIAQASWFHYEELAKYPKIAQLYELTCQELGCDLPVLSNISKIENGNLVVRSHPTIFDALIIETIITNHASFEQAFPNISLSFSNINNQAIAQRLFKPAEYLNKELLSWPGMPSEQPIQITFEIIDPGPEAVNYKINFHPPQ